MAVRLKRIHREIFNYNKDPVPGTAIIFNEEGTTVDVLIFGPKDTPYEYGASHFYFAYPEDYPTNPIKVTFQTTDGGRVRFNPNLYNCGKVCLSVLGTWGENDWTPAQNLSSIILSIQALVFVREPLLNEPSIMPSAADIKTHQDCIRYHTLRVLCNNDCVGPFAETAKKHIVDNFEGISELLIRGLFLEGKTIAGAQQLIPTRINYRAVMERIEKLTEMKINRKVNPDSDPPIPPISEKIVAECNICFRCIRPPNESDDGDKYIDAFNFLDKCKYCTYWVCKNCIAKWYVQSRICPQCKKGKAFDGMFFEEELGAAAAKTLPYASPGNVINDLSALLATITSSIAIPLPVSAAPTFTSYTAATTSVPPAISQPQGVYEQDNILIGRHRHNYLQQRTWHKTKKITPENQELSAFIKLMAAYCEEQKISTEEKTYSELMEEIRPNLVELEEKVWEMKKMTFGIYTAYDGGKVYGFYATKYDNLYLCQEDTPYGKQMINNYYQRHPKILLEKKIVNDAGVWPHIYNGRTKRWVLKDGAVGKKVLAEIAEA